MNTAGTAACTVRRILVRDYLELTKPRLSLLVMVTTLAGYWMGAPQAMAWGRLWHVLLGTALVVGGANALNEWRERDLDALMRRTKDRPLPSGRLAPSGALRFGAALSVAGLMWLGLFVNVLSAGLAAISWISYVLVYTPMKRHTALCTLIGAVPGALPPMIGWTGAQGTLALGAWMLFAILFVWQLPHFLALATLYRDDYAHAGFWMLPRLEPTGAVAGRQMALSGLALVPISLFPAVIGIGGPGYFFCALALSLGFLWLAVRAAWARSLPAARQLFHASVLYLPLLLGVLAASRIGR